MSKNKYQVNNYLLFTIVFMKCMTVVGNVFQSILTTNQLQINSNTYVIEFKCFIIILDIAHIFKMNTTTKLQGHRATSGQHLASITYTLSINKLNMEENSPRK